MSLAAILSMAMAAFKMLTSLCGFGSGVLAQFHDANSRQAGRDDVTAKQRGVREIRQGRSLDRNAEVAQRRVERGLLVGARLALPDDQRAGGEVLASRELARAHPGDHHAAGGDAAFE